MERIGSGDVVELAFSVPPRHFKSTTLQHGVAWLFKQLPGFRAAYLTHSKELAEAVSREMMRIVQRAGLPLGDRVTYREWNTANGCTFLATGLIGGITGLGFDLIIVDDPYRKRQDAESYSIRSKTIESFKADVYTRQDNKPTSFIVLHTRWHEDDLIGHITSAQFRDGAPFEYINLPAIDDDGNALCPEFWPTERLATTRATVGEYEWWSQFMGQPRPRGSAVFGTPVSCRWDEVPREGRHSIGIDLAYSAKTHSDYSVSLMLRQCNGKVYVVDVRKEHAKAPEFAMVLRGHMQRAPGATPRWYCSGTEAGVADLLGSMGVRVDAVKTTADKFTRAQAVAAAWNRGEIVVPDAAWAPQFLDEVMGFTGVGDAHDDQVDALAAAYDALGSALTGHVETTGRLQSADQYDSQGIRRRGIRREMDVY